MDIVRVVLLRDYCYELKILFLNVKRLNKFVKFERCKSKEKKVKNALPELNSDLAKKGNL